MAFIQLSKIHIYNAMMTEGTDLNLHSVVKSHYYKLYKIMPKFPRIVGMFDLSNSLFFFLI